MASSLGAWSLGAICYLISVFSYPSSLYVLTTPKAAWISAFGLILTFPDPPMMEPYMVSTKNKVETMMSEIKDAIVILWVQVAPPKEN